MTRAFIWLSILGLWLSACAPAQTPASRLVATIPAPPSAVIPTPTPFRDAPLNPGPLVYANVPLLQYSHPNYQFQVPYPGNWDVFEQENGVIFIDPTVKGGYSILLSATDDPVSAQALAEFTPQFVTDTFGGENGFELLDDTRGPVRFKSVNPTFGATINEVTLLAQDNVIYVLVVTVAEDYWAEAAPALHKLTAGLVLPETPPDFGAQATPEGPPMWELYAHPSAQFAFLYPSNWELSQRDGATVATWPAHDFEFTVRTVPAVGNAADLPLVKEYIETEAEMLASIYDNFEMLPVSDYAAAGQTGFTVDFLYQPPDEAFPVAGSIMAVGVNDRIYDVRIQAPAPAYENALGWFNPMMQSFQIIKE